MTKVSGLTLTPEEIFTAIAAVHRRVRGAYAAVAMIAGYGVVAFRDPHGIRPLVYGQRENEEGRGREVVVASESVALDSAGFELVRDVAPGEAIFIDIGGRVYSRQCADHPRIAPCIFEYVYLARPDSIIDRVSVYKARLTMGELLAEKILRTWPDHDIDVIIPIPDTSRTAALQMASSLGVKYREGFIKNRYIGRTFIMPGQKMRRKSVRQKLNAIGREFKGHNVLLVDDSIVRGTTSQEIIQMARDVGARKVYFASAAPPVRYANVYGIDMPSPEELIAHGRSEEEVGRAIGADRLIFQDLEDLEAAVRWGNSALKGFENSCFTGRYITGDISSDYLASLEQRRNDAAKARREGTPVTEVDNKDDDDVLDLHNAS